MDFEADEFRRTVCYGNRAKLTKGCTTQKPQIDIITRDYLDKGYNTTLHTLLHCPLEVVVFFSLLVPIKAERGKSFD